MIGVRTAALVLAPLAAGALWMALSPGGSEPLSGGQPATGQNGIPSDDRPGVELSPTINPLSSIGKDALDDIVSRPLFTPGRAGASQELVISEDEPQPVAVDSAMSEADFTLLGIIDAGGQRTALLRQNKTNIVGNLKAGDSGDGWVLKSIGERSVTIESGSTQFDVQVFGAPPESVRIE